nr:MULTISPECIES: Na+/H+ antiporter subunit A [unclassified Corynebacterium]
MILLGALTAAAVLAPVLIRSLGRPAFGLLALAPLAGFAWVLRQFLSGPLGRGEAIVSHTGWLSSLNMNIVFRLDGLAGIFSLIILGVGALVLLYCWGYFDSNPRRLSLFGAQMVAFSMAMFGLVTSDSVLLMYIFWELTSVLSFLLVGYYGERASSRHAANQALMVTTLGGLTMLVGFIVLGQSGGVWYFSDLAALPDPAAVPHITVAIILILIGALSKSAIAPVHFWLPGAMAAPTPVSAYLHSAAMVKAGIYLVARLAPDLHAVQTWHLVLIPVGIFTMLMSGWMALRQKDLKLILAYGTVSQLGFLMAVVSVGSREAMLAGLALTCAHSLFKATLFMVVGAIDHATGTRNTDELSGLGRVQPYIFVLAALAAASMAGIPPLFGFVAKEAALEAILHEELLVGMPGRLMLVGMVLGSILTMAYSCFFLHGAFATKSREHPSGGATSQPVAAMHAIGPKLYAAPTVLIALTLALGVHPPLIGRFFAPYLDATFPANPGTTAAHLALWHGFGIPLLLSTVIVVLGALLFWQRHLLRYLQAEEPALGSADTAYDAIVAFLRRASLRLTASTQRGSLMVNLGIIFAVLTLLPLAALIAGERNNIRMELWGNPWQAVLATIIVAMAIGATRTHNRLSGVIMVGVTGYGLAMIFALHGAPDLALTQVLVETIVMVVFMLVLRKMPTGTQWRGTPKGNRNRAWLSIAVGLSVTIVTLFALNARQEEPIAQFMPDLAYRIGHGANAVNVLLVDIRAWDTLGEISVLVIAATGVASLIYGTRSFSRASRRPTLSTVGRRWLSAESDTEKAQNRSLMVDVITRVAFPSMIVLSMYFFFAGHNAPGGGFAGGLVAALALSLRYLAGGRAELEAALPIDAGRLLGSGLLLSALAALWPMALGRPPLTTQVWDLTLPLIGETHLPSALLFDAGVYLIVIGLTMHILTSLGAQIDLDEAARRQRARDRARSMAREAQRRRRATTTAPATGKENAENGR